MLFAVHARYAEASLVQADRCAICALRERLAQMLCESSTSHRLGWKGEEAKSGRFQFCAAPTVGQIVHVVRPEATAAAAVAAVMRWMAMGCKAKSSLQEIERMQSRCNVGWGLMVDLIQS